MYNQQNFSNFAGSTSSFGGMVASQYRGMNKSFQPTGTVPSVYGQMSGNAYGGYQSQNPQSFHTAGYRGNQQGHDNYLRSDASHPSVGSQFGTSSWGGASQMQQMNNPSSFHTSGYRGNQQGHDQYLHADATRPSMSSSFGGTGAGSYATSSYGTSQFGTGSYGTGSFGTTGSPYSSFQNAGAGSFHTSNYRGNQQGHDQYLHADATRPSASSQFGTTSYSGYGAGRF